MFKLGKTSCFLFWLKKNRPTKTCAGGLEGKNKCYGDIWSHVVWVGSSLCANKHKGVWIFLFNCNDSDKHAWTDFPCFYYVLLWQCLKPVCAETADEDLN